MNLEVPKAIIDKYNIELFVIFGSYANNKNKQDSDLEILSEEFAKDIAPSTGIRNRLVHEYEEVDNKVVYQNLYKLIKYYFSYIEYINKRIS